MPTTEPIRGLTEPVVAGDAGVWGGFLNNTIAALAGILGTTITFPSTTYGTAATLTSSQAQASRLVVGNTGASPFQINLPASNFANGPYIVANNSSQGQNLTVTAGSSGTGGTNAVVPPNVQRIVFSDGTNISFADGSFPLQAGLAFGFDGGTVAPSSGIKPGFVLPFTFVAQSWAVTSWDTAGAISVDVQYNGTTASTHNTPTLTSSFNATGSASGWSVTTFTSGNTLAPFINSASSATKFSLTVQGIRIT